MRAVGSLSRTHSSLSGASTFWELSGFPDVAGQPASAIAISPSASRRRVAASWLRAVSGTPSGSLPPFAARSAAPLMYLAARRSNAGGNRIPAGSPACSGAAPAVICPSPDSVLGVGGDDVPQVIGRLVRRPYLHRLGQGRDGDPHQRQRQRNGPWRLHQVGAGPFAGDLEQHPPGHVLDDLVAEIGAGRRLGDAHQRRYGTDLPGDQLTGTLPVQVHAGRSELLHEHVDLAVEPRTSRHVASLPPSRHKEAASPPLPFKEAAALGLRGRARIRGPSTQLDGSRRTPQDDTAAKRWSLGRGNALVP